jgi:serine/threonine-protein kinase
MDFVTDELRRVLADRYELLRELGRGGMATVYLARDVRHARQVAIKVLHPELAAVLGAERFLAEIKTTANLQHPHILPLFDSGSADGQLFYVMPFVDGETLRARLDRETQLPIADAVLLAREVADALQYAHERGVIHRDIKPENILLQGGHALVADFGIALAVQQAGGQRMTQTGLSLGTPQYMAPEQAMGEKAIDARADIYALGAVTYEMLAGEPPFTGPTPQAIVARVMTERPQSLSRQRETVPAALEAAVMTAMSKLPADRFATARALRDALDVQSDRVDARVESARQPRSARRLTTLLCAGALLFVAGFLLNWQLSRADRRDELMIRHTLVASPGAQLLTNTIGVLAISPQGDRIAFVESDSLGEHVVIRRVNETGGRRIVVPRPRALTFSPDGQSLAFVSERAVRRVAVDSGAPITLATLPEGNFRGMTWTLRDTLLLGGERMYLIPSSPGAIVTIDSGGRWPVAVSRDVVLMNVIDTLVAFRLTDRRRINVGARGMIPLGLLNGHVLYHSFDGTTQQALLAARFDLAELRVTGAPFTVVDSVAANLTTGSLAALSASGTVIYTRGDSRQELVSVSADGGSTTVLATGWFEEPRYSPDGLRIAFFDRGVKVLDVRSGTIAQLSPDRGRGGQPEWLPDGKRLMYNAAPEQRIIRVDGGPVTGSDSIVSCERGTGSAVFSPDASLVLCVSIANSRRSNRVSVVPFPGTGTPKPLLAGSANTLMPRVSPNGQWVAFQSDESNGQYEIFVMPFPGGGAHVRVSTRGGVEPLWDRTGRTLYYRDVGNLYSVEMDPATGSRTLEPRVVLRGTYALHRRGAHANYDVAPDSRSFLMVRPLEGGLSTVVAHHWAQELNARIARAEKSGEGATAR